MTGCTFGKGNLIHRDHGKSVFTFVRRADGKAIRIVTRPDGWPPDHPERRALFEKAGAGAATAAERRRLQARQDGRALAVLALPEEQLFDLHEVQVELPTIERGFASAPCDACGESTRETRLRHVHGRNLCGSCLAGAAPAQRFPSPRGLPGDPVAAPADDRER